MIRQIVDFALRSKMLVLSIGVLLLAWGIISFHRLPVEAYPDVADKYAWVITQWPGRAAEEVEQQVTIPIETQLNGVGHKRHLRSLSISGLSFITVIFDDDSHNLQNRQQVLEKLTLVNLPPQGSHSFRCGSTTRRRPPPAGSVPRPTTGSSHASRSPPWGCRTREFP